MLEANAGAWGPEAVHPRHQQNEVHSSAACAAGLGAPWSRRLPGDAAEPQPKRRRITRWTRSTSRGTLTEAVQFAALQGCGGQMTIVTAGRLMWAHGSAKPTAGTTCRRADKWQSRQRTASDGGAKRSLGTAGARFR